MVVISQDGGDGLHFLYIKRNGLYFVGATKFNIPPAFGLELLSRYVGDIDVSYILSLLSPSPSLPLPPSPSLFPPTPPP